MMSESALIEQGELSRALGQERIVEIDRTVGRAVIEYRVGPHMCHSGGVAQGGFVTGWIDSTMAQAAIAVTGHSFIPMSLEIKVSFFLPAAPGLVTAEAWIERRGRSTMFLEGRLLSDAGAVLAKASSTVRLVPRPQAAV